MLQILALIEGDGDTRKDVQEERDFIVKSLVKSIKSNLVQIKEVDIERIIPLAGYKLRTMPGIDLASYDDNTIPKILFEAMNEIFLVAGGRAYEQEVLISTMEKIMPEKVNLVFNLTSNERLSLLQEKYKDKAKIVSSITYETDQFKTGIWNEEIFNLFSQYKQNDNEVINK